jgi:predicted lactoylglutathione lyase
MSVIKNIFRFYRDGFRNMPRWGKQLWIIIILKGIVIFILIRFLFFPNFLKTEFKTDQERSDHIIEQLTNKKENDTNEH